MNKELKKRLESICEEEPDEIDEIMIADAEMDDDGTRVPLEQVLGGINDGN